MTSVVLLEQLKAFTEKIMADMILPVAMQQGDTEQAYRAPEVYLMRLPDSRSAKKKAPYIIHHHLNPSDVGARLHFSHSTALYFGVLEEKRF